ncbi:uncharacterized protein LOC126747054 isoform X1 [Anthonomus grandis grandis]|uniref:uncharacterized protein LOC126747054 isoform X1 n=1 Tax=Anthonomus grandis grandis TaxID=2921223 RepID=UPI002166BF79|nr:uncharacterized protein LOC126747054 isoform X1 [Anthonomus grandis grandis]
MADIKFTLQQLERYNDRMKNCLSDPQCRPLLQKFLNLQRKPMFISALKLWEAANGTGNWDEDRMLDLIEDVDDFNENPLLSIAECQHKLDYTKEECSRILNKVLPDFMNYLHRYHKLDILHKMFKFIDHIKEVETKELLKPVTLKDLKNLMETDVNIFPEFGATAKVLTDEEREEKLKQMRINIQEITAKKEKLKDSSSLVDENKKRMESILATMQKNLSQLDRVVNEIVGESSTRVEPKYKVDPQFPVLLKECNDALKTVVQYSEDLQTLRDFKVEELKLPTNELMPLIDGLAEQMIGLFGEPETEK